MHILVGKACQYHGGVNPTHSLTLRHNGSAELRLRSYGPEPDVVWQSSPELVLENALLMIALHVCELPQLKAQAARFDKLKHHDESDLVGCNESQKLRALHKRCRKLFPTRCKLVITVCDQSAARGQLPILKGYPMEVEVCTPEFQRLWNMWSKADDKMETLGDIYHGVLEVLPPPPTGELDTGDDLGGYVIRKAHHMKRRKALRRPPEKKPKRRKKK